MVAVGTRVVGDEVERGKQTDTTFGYKGYGRGGALRGRGIKEDPSFEGR